MLEPNAWPSLVAEAKSLIRERLTGYDVLLEVNEILTIMLNDRGFEHFTHNPREAQTRYGNEYVLLSGELVWAVGEAIRQLEAEAEIRTVSGSTPPPAVRMMWERIGLPAQAVSDYRIPQVIGCYSETGRTSAFR